MEVYVRLWVWHAAKNDRRFYVIMSVERTWLDDSFYVNFFRCLLDWQLYVLAVYEIEAKWKLGGFGSIARVILNQIILTLFSLTT